MAEVIRERVVDRPVERVYERPSTSGNGIGFLIGAILLAIVLYLLFFYGLPFIRTAAKPSQTNIQLPDKIDVNVNNPK